MPAPAHSFRMRASTDIVTRSLSSPSSRSSPSATSSPVVQRVRSISLRAVTDPRGILCFSDFSNLPFIPRRHFIVAAPPGESSQRGGHAHRKNLTLLQCVAGIITVTVDDGVNRSQVVMDSSKLNEALLLGELVWADLAYSPGAVLLALCSEEFEEADYIRTYDQFLLETRAMHANVVSVPAGVGHERELSVVKFLDLKAAAQLAEPALTQAVQRVIKSGTYVLGPEVAQFEQAWAKQCGKQYCVGVGSGLAALQLMLAAADIGAGDEVIVPANTYIATALAVSHCGATPVFADADFFTRNIDPAKALEKITPKCKAILAVDLYGQPADYPVLRRICDAKNLLLFSDAAQSHGAAVDGLPPWSLCDAVAFSFYPSKNLGAIGEAGCVVTDSSMLAQRIEGLRNYGSRHRFVNVERGWNERMDPMQAAILCAKLPHLKGLNSRRAATAAVYMQAFAKLDDWLRLPLTVAGTTPSWHLFVIALPRNLREPFRAHMSKHGIETAVHYPTPPHLSNAYKDLNLAEGSFPVAEELADCVISLPICPFLTESDKQRVIDAVVGFEEVVRSLPQGTRAQVFGHPRDDDRARADNDAVGREGTRKAAPEGPAYPAA